MDRKLLRNVDGPIGLTAAAADSRHLKDTGGTYPDISSVRRRQFAGKSLGDYLLGWPRVAGSVGRRCEADHANLCGIGQIRNIV